MKILQVIPFFTPARGGSVIAPYCLSKELSKKGHDVTIITTDFEFDEEYAKSLDDVRVIPFKCTANLGLFLYSPKMKKWLRDNIKNYDVVHMHNFRSYQNNIIHNYAKRFGVPYVLQAHGSLPRIVEKQRLKKLYDLIWGYKILRDASKVIALTKVEKEQYKDMSVDEDKIEIIPNGIDFSRYKNLPKKEEFKGKYKLKDTEKIVLYLGRIHKIKGINLLVEAFSDLTKELDGIKLVIVGPDDGFLSALKKKIDDLNIDDKILFTGPLFEREKLSAYIDADVFVLPSIYETFPNSVLEACACGVPVIVTKSCGISDFVEKIGYVVEYDREQLRNILFKILVDKRLRKRVGEKGRKLVIKEFSLDKTVEKMEKVYLSLMK